MTTLMIGYETGGAESFADTKEVLGGAAFPGVGEQAIRAGNSVYALKGDYVLNIVVLGLEGDAATQALTTLANAALARLP